MKTTTIFNKTEILHNLEFEVALHDVDLTDGDSVVACVFKGTLREDKCNGGTVDANVKSKLNLIKFVKGV